jgi:hypothetical protein
VLPHAAAAVYAACWRNCTLRACIISRAQPAATEGCLTVLRWQAWHSQRVALWQAMLDARGRQREDGAQQRLIGKSHTGAGACSVATTVHAVRHAAASNAAVDNALKFPGLHLPRTLHMQLCALLC